MNRSNYFDGDTTNGDMDDDHHHHYNFTPVFCPENLTFEIFGHNRPVPRQDGVYVALAVFHILFVLIPATLLSALAMYYLVKRVDKHPTNIIFLWICVDCFLGPSTYGLLMDLSFFFDLPILGRCERRWEGMLLWLCYACAVTAYDFLLAFGAITYYASLKYNIRSVNIRKMNIALFVILVFSFIIASIWLIIAETQVTWSCRVQGSFCYTFFDGGKRTVAIVLEVIRIGCAVLPLNAIVFVSVVLYILKVRSSVVRFDRSLAKSILLLFVVLTGGSMLWNIPTLIMHFGSFDGSERGFIEMLSTYTLQLNFVFFPLLVLTLHRDAVKETFFHVVDRFLDLVCVPCCDYFCNLRSVGTQVQQSIRMRDRPDFEEMMTENSQFESAMGTSTVKETTSLATEVVAAVEPANEAGAEAAEGVESSEGSLPGLVNVVVVNEGVDDHASYDNPFDDVDPFDSLPPSGSVDSLISDEGSDENPDGNPDGNNHGSPTDSDENLEFVDSLDYFDSFVDSDTLEYVDAVDFLPPNPPASLVSDVENDIDYYSYMDPLDLHPEAEEDPDELDSDESTVSIVPPPNGN